MTRIHSLLVLSALGVTVVSLACTHSESTAPSGEPAAVTSVGSSSPVAPDPAEEVGYEPAYPDDVSTEGLTDEDVAQQETSHSHGDGEEHVHGEGSHSHDPEVPGKEEPNDDHEQ